MRIFLQHIDLQNIVEPKTQENHIEEKKKNWWQLIILTTIRIAHKRELNL